MTNTRHEPEPWELLVDEEGRLERRVEAGLLLVPREIEMKGDLLVWRSPRLVDVYRLKVYGEPKVKKRHRRRFDGVPLRQMLRALRQEDEEGGRDVQVVPFDEEGWASVASGVYRHVRPGPRMLADFIDLQAASPDRILGFARRWGVLGICSHGEPYSHNPPYGPVDMGHRETGRCFPPCFKGSRDIYWEPISAWRMISQDAHAILNLAGRLRDDLLGVESDWSVLVRTRPHLLRGSDWTRRLTSQRFALTTVINRWLLDGHVHPMLSWMYGPLRAEMSAGFLTIGRLYGALGVQLMMAAAGVGGFAVCSGCASIYVPRRRRAANRRRYCLKCRRSGIPERDAARDYRQRKKGGSGSAGRS